MVSEESMILDYLRSRQGEEIPRWTLITHVAKLTVKPQMKLSEAKLEILGLCRRLIREKKIKRNKRKGTFRINEAFLQT